MRETLREARNALHRNRHRNLLVAIVAALMVRPLIGDSGVGPVLFSIALLLVMLLAVFAIQVDDMRGDRVHLLAERRRRRIITACLAVPAMLERASILFFPNTFVLRLGTVTWLLLLGFITWCLLRDLLRSKEITGEIIGLSVAIYLLFGMTFGILYVVILEQQPHAFRFAPGEPALSSWTDPHVFATLIFFSLTTLSTLGFGDIAPATMLARYTAVAEGISGQFYLAILVARLVGMHMSQRREHHLDDP